MELNQTITEERIDFGFHLETGDLISKATVVNDSKQFCADFEKAVKVLCQLPKRLELIAEQVRHLHAQVQSYKTNSVDAIDIDDLTNKVVSQIDFPSLAVDVTSELDMDEIASQVSECIDIADLADRVKDDISDDVVTEAVKEIANRLHRR